MDAQQQQLPDVEPEQQAVEQPAADVAVQEAVSQNSVNVTENARNKVFSAPSSPASSSTFPVSPVSQASLSNLVNTSASTTSPTMTAERTSAVHLFSSTPTHHYNSDVSYMRRQMATTRYRPYFNTRRENIPSSDVNDVSISNSLLATIVVNNGDTVDPPAEMDTLSSTATVSVANEMQSLNGTFTASATSYSSSDDESAPMMNGHRIDLSAPGTIASSRNLAIASTSLGRNATMPGAQKSSGMFKTKIWRSPRKSLFDLLVLKTLRNQIDDPEFLKNDLNLMSLSTPAGMAHGITIVKKRYLLSSVPNSISQTAFARTPASYRHLIDLTSASLKATDIFTERDYICKIINEPYEKVLKAYFMVHQDHENLHSTIHGHSLIRCAHDIEPLDCERTYVIIAPTTESPKDYRLNRKGPIWEFEPDHDSTLVYEDLHTYIRFKRRLSETEARSLFHQICQTVRLCHRHGIILRDLKLKRFFFIDAARTKIQYESLEGSMILDDLSNDSLAEKIGCPLYTAPELLCPSPSYHGKPADMWSLGVILFTMIVGQYPFYEKGNTNLITIIRNTNVVLPPFVSRPVRWLVQLLLRKNYKERITAEQIFRVPWLRKLKPFYMSIPVDVVIPDGDDDDDEQPSSSKGSNIDRFNMMKYSAHMYTLTSTDDFMQQNQVANFTRSSVAMSHRHSSYEPLNYSRQALEFHRLFCNGHIRHSRHSRSSRHGRFGRHNRHARHRHIREEMETAMINRNGEMG